MNRTEALHILGLEDDATADDIKIAYREDGADSAPGQVRGQ